MKSPLSMACTLILSAIFIASNLYMMIPLQTELAQTFHVPLTTAGLTSSLFIFPYAIGLFLFGLLADRLPHKTILVIGMLLLSIDTFMLSLTITFSWLLILRIIQGILAASFAPTAFSYSFEHFHGKKQALVIAMINTGFLAAGIFGQMISAGISQAYNYQSVFLFFAFIYFILSLWMIGTLRGSQKRKWTKQSLTPILSFFRHQQLRKLYLTAFFLLFTVMLFYGCFEIYVYTEDMNLPFSMQMFRLIGLVGIIPSFFTGNLKERFGAVRVLTSFLGLMSVSSLLPLIQINAWTVLMASVGMIASTSVTIPMVILLIGFYGSKARASAVAIYSFTLLTGASVASFLAPLIKFPVVLVLFALIFTLLVLMNRKGMDNQIVKKVHK